MIINIPSLLILLFMVCLLNGLAALFCDFSVIFDSIVIHPEFDAAVFAHQRQDLKSGLRLLWSLRISRRRRLREKRRIQHERK